MIFIPQTNSESYALNKARQRGIVLRVAKGIYTDDFHTPLTEIVREQLLAILGAAYPDWYVSHSTAALSQTKTEDGHLRKLGASTALGGSLHTQTRLVQSEP